MISHNKNCLCSLICVILICVTVCTFISCSSSPSMHLFNLISSDGNITGDDYIQAAIETGMALSKAVEEITPEQEYYIGRAVAANLLNTYNIEDNDLWQDYVNKICHVIIINSDKPDLFNGYHVVILDTDEVNAFATSGGHIMITRGLIDCTKTEDELAAVIAHEIAHIQLQHSIKAIRTSRITNALAVTAQTALKFSGVEELSDLADVLDESVDEIVMTLVNSGYSQAQEFAADSTALSLMQKAGYESSAMKDMLLMLKEKTANVNTGFGKTHPSADDRLEAVDQVLKMMEYKEPLRFSSRYRALEERNIRYVRVQLQAL